jgi:hypothetical protein
LGEQQQEQVSWRAEVEQQEEQQQERVYWQEQQEEVPGEQA